MTATLKPVKAHRAPLNITLTMATLPDVTLAPNRQSGQHWSKRSNPTKESKVSAYSELVLALERTALHPFNAILLIPKPWHVSWTVHWPKGVRAWDADALALMFKPWQDAFMTLSWVTNDSPKYIRRVSYESVPSSPQGPCIVLRIESA